MLDPEAPGSQGDRDIDDSLAIDVALECTLVEGEDFDSTNYVLTGELEATYTVNPIEVTVTTTVDGTDATSALYNGDAHTVEVAQDPEEPVVLLDPAYTLTYVPAGADEDAEAEEVGEIRNAGAYTITPNVSDEIDEKNVTVNAEPFTFEVTPIEAATTITVTPDEFYEGEAEPEVEYSSDNDKVTVTGYTVYAADDEDREDALFTNELPTTAGEYLVVADKVEFAEGEEAVNYDVTYGSATLTIKGERRKVYVDWDANDVLDYVEGKDAYRYAGPTRVYFYDEDGNIREIGFWVEGLEVRESWGDEVRGIHTAEISDIDEDEFDVSEAELTHNWTVKDAVSKTTEYTGKAQGLDPDASNNVRFFFTDEREPSEEEAEMSPYEYPEIWKTTSPTHINAGTYEMWYKQIVYNRTTRKNEWSEPRKAVLIITPVEVEIELKPVTMQVNTFIHNKTQDNNLVIGDFKDITLVNNEKAADKLVVLDSWYDANYYKKDGVAWNWVGNDPSALGVGTYKVEFNTKPNTVVTSNPENYKVTVKEDKTGLLTVTKATFDVTWSNGDLVYSGYQQSVQIDSYKAPNGETYEFEYTGNTAVDVGTYTAKVIAVFKIVDGKRVIEENYWPKTDTKSWKITARKVVVVVDPETTLVPYGSADPDSLFSINDLKVYDLGGIGIGMM